MTEPTIYLLDDEEALVDLHCEVAEMAGFSARGFTRASQFFEQVVNFETGSVLVLDLHMPEMDGIEVMRRLAQMHNTPALILVSGHDAGVLHSAEKLCKAHGLEVIGSFRKPLSLDVFQELLEQYIPAGMPAENAAVSSLSKEISKSSLQQAIKKEQLVLHYQPQVNIATGELSGIEALVRWQHPNIGLIYPDSFLSVVEHNGLMSELTHWVIDKAVRQEQQWQKQGLHATMSVNISALDITGLMLPEQLAELLNDNRLDSSHLTLEVTERALMGELVTSLDILTRFRLKGLSLSIDDFGTGYSSLSQLHRVPFTELKVDRSFVSNMDSDNEACAIVKTCIILGHELNMLVVAEGVENKEQLNMLESMGCDFAQGYHIANPMTAGDFIHWNESVQQGGR
ncbi:MAG TPA: EAL domain-containing response regulator [Gammaproteobacteria bacterium]|nr:EAL domain-containing response regulator [Gammaproteobacteria bacterium]